MADVIIKKAGMNIVQEDLDYPSVLPHELDGAVYVPPETTEDTVSGFSNTEYPGEADNIRWNSVKFRWKRKTTDTSSPFSASITLWGINGGEEHLIGELIKNTIGTSETVELDGFLMASNGAEPTISFVPTVAPAGKIGVKLPKRFSEYYNFKLRKNWIEPYDDGAGNITPWLYRKKINISNTSGSSSENYTLENIVIAFISGKMNANFSDIRFTHGDGVTVIPCWQESRTDSSTSTWSVMLNPIQQGSSYIWVYYGCAPAPSVSSLVDTFPDGCVTFDDGFVLGGYSESGNSNFSLSNDASVYKDGNGSNKFTFPASTACAANAFCQFTWDISYLEPGQRYWLAVNARDDKNTGQTNYWWKRLHWANGDTYPLIQEIDCCVTANHLVWEKLAGFIDYEDYRMVVIMKLACTQALTNLPINVWWDNLRVKHVLVNSSGVTTEPTYTLGSTEETQADFTMDSALDDDTTIYFTISSNWNDFAPMRLVVVDELGNELESNVQNLKLTNTAQLAINDTHFEGLRLKFEVTTDNKITWNVYELLYNYSVLEDDSKWEA